MCISKKDYMAIALAVEKGVVSQRLGHPYTLTDLALDLSAVWKEADPFFDEKSWLRKAVGFVPSQP